MTQQVKLVHYAQIMAASMSVEGFEDYLKLKGIHHDLTIPHTPEQNRVAGKINDCSY